VSIKFGKNETQWILRIESHEVITQVMRGKSIQYNSNGYQSLTSACAQTKVNGVEFYITYDT